MIYKVLILCFVVFLSSCSSTMHTAIEPQQLEEVIKQHLVLLPNQQFDKLPHSLKENEIIFLGEQHYVKSLADAADQLAVYLANDKPVVYALETCFGLGSFMEAASLGHPKAAQSIVLPGPIQTFNSRQTDSTKKIVMTAIDIEHTIFHTKTEPVLFLQDLAHRSASDMAVQAINKEIAQLTAQDTYDKMNRYLKNLKKVFLEYSDTFSPEDRDEISFYFDLLQASNRYQYICFGNKKDRQNPHDIRYRYYKKTIERAYRKARQRKAILLCRVGSWHISSDHRCEARYFANSYASTKGKVASIRLTPLDDGTHETNDTVTEKHKDIDSIVNTLMKDNEYSYLSLSDLQKSTAHSFQWSKHFSKKGPKYDGVLFVKREEPQGP